jgi:hypothetical protein
LFGFGIETAEAPKLVEMPQGTLSQLKQLQKAQLADIAL